MLNIGTQSTLLVVVNEVLDLAITNKPPIIILIYSHPSGDIKPTESDLEFIKKMKGAAEATARTFLDFIIVGTVRKGENNYWNTFEESNRKKYLDEDK